MEDATQGRRRAAAGRSAAAAGAAAHSHRLLAGVLARLGGRSQRRHGRPVPAGRARSVRLPHGLLLAGAGAGSVESRARLDGQVRGGAEGLAQDRPDLPGREEVAAARARRTGRQGCLCVALPDRHARRRRSRRWCVAAQRFGKGADAQRRRSTCSTSAPTPATSRSSTRRTEKQIGEIKLQTGIPRSLILSQQPAEASTCSTRRSKRSRSSTSPRATSLGALHAERGQQEDAHPQHAGGSARALHDPADADRDQAVDRWEISDVALQLYDLREKRITRTIPWPGGEERENVNIRFSPDGKLLYFFGDDILIVETENFTEVDTWPISRPIESGSRPRQLRPVDDINDDPGLLHRSLHDAGPGAEPPHHGHRPRQPRRPRPSTSARSGRPKA